MHISEICTRSPVTCNRDTPAAELARKTIVISWSR